MTKYGLSTLKGIKYETYNIYKFIVLSWEGGNSVERFQKTKKMKEENENKHNAIFLLFPAQKVGV